ncbi:MAG: ABC transporter permease [Chitinophagaceae bacterium]
MDVSWFIAKRIALKKQPSYSRFITRLATAATAVSVAAMIITLAFVNGFQKTVSEKVFGFWGHIRVQQYESAKSIVAEETAILHDPLVVTTVQQMPGVSHVQSFATKSAVIQFNKDIEGVLLKGVDSNYNFNNLQGFLKAGRWPRFSDSLYSKEIAISTPLATMLGIALNDTVKLIFIGNTSTDAQFRKLQVVGLYKTGIDAYDKLFALGDIRLIRRINQWEPNAIGGYEVFLRDYTQMDSLNARLYEQLPGTWVSRTMREIFPNIFDWLNIQDVNRDLIFIIMGVVAVINLITSLLILILERVKMVGVFKALGATNWHIQKIFVWQSSFIALIGVGIGAFIGIGLCLLQQHFQLIKLNELEYYVSTAPIHIIWWQILVVCIVTMLICFISLLLPSMLVTKINPVKAIQFR